MERKFTVKYKLADKSQGGTKEKTEKRNLETYDSEKDNDIFALGDAATDADFNPDNIDELLKNFGINLDDLKSQLGEGGKIITKVHVQRTPIGGPGEDEMPSLPMPEGFSSEGSVVHTETKTLPSGQKIRTKIIKGPVQRTTKIIQRRIGPDGKVITHEATSPMITLKHPFRTQEEQPLVSPPSVENDDGEGSEYEYAPLRSEVPSTEDTGNKHQSERIIDFPPNRRPQTPTPPITILPPPSPSSRPIAPTPPITILPPTPSRSESSVSIPIESDTYTPGFPVLPDNITQSNIPASPQPIPSSPAKTSDQNTTNKEQDHYKQINRSSFSHTPFDRPDVTLTPKAFKRRLPWLTQHLNNKVKAGKKPVTKRPEELQLRKGKTGMCASEVGQIQNLPALSVLVANYARMLIEDKQEFADTLFRAIKLDNIEVTKILCKIVQKSGLKLSSPELREPESSATVLHVALLYNHEDIVDYLLSSKDQELIMAKYTNEEYRNQTSLHVAVVNCNTDMVEKLLSSLDKQICFTLVNTVANGNYFLLKHPYGQTCLSAATWAGKGEILKTLVKYGANLGLQTHAGNTVLHCIIQLSLEFAQHNFKDLLNHVWEAAYVKAEQVISDNSSKNVQKRVLKQKQHQVDIFRELMAIRNNDGYTPLALAALESSRVFKDMINMETLFKIPQNKLGSIAWVTFDVTDVTSFSYDTYNKFSVLHTLAHSSQGFSRSNFENEDEDFHDMEPISSLLHCKWQTYRWVYIIWFVIHLFYMMVFTALTANANSCPAPYNATHINKTNSCVRGEIHLAFAGFLVLPIVYLILELLDLCGNHPYRAQYMSNQNYIKRALKCVQSQWTITGNGPYRLVNIMFSSFVIMWFFLYFSYHLEQDIALAMSLLLGWVYVLFFTKGCRVTCRFSIMIQQMFFRDLLYFLTVYVIILIGFSFAMNANFNYNADAEHTMGRVIYDMMNVVTDLDDKMSATQARHPTFGKLLLIFYAIVAVILLMNMLIAMMNTSYETVRLTRCNIWKQQVLSVLLLIERRFFWWKWLCRTSEQDVWRRETDDEMRCYIDVTVLNMPSGKVEPSSTTTTPTN